MISRPRYRQREDRRIIVNVISTTGTQPFASSDRFIAAQGSGAFKCCSLEQGLRSLAISRRVDAHFSLTERLSLNSNVPNRENVSSEKREGCVTTNAALGYFDQTQRSSAVTSTKPYGVWCRPGSVVLSISAHISFFISASPKARSL
jgi:hypothetical protein